MLVERTRWTGKSVNLVGGVTVIILPSHIKAPLVIL